MSWKLLRSFDAALRSERMTATVQPRTRIRTGVLVLWVLGVSNGHMKEKSWEYVNATRTRA